MLVSKRHVTLNRDPSFLLFIRLSCLYGIFEVKGFVASGEFRKLDRNGIARREERTRNKLIHTEALNLKIMNPKCFEHQHGRTSRKIQL